MYFRRMSLAIICILHRRSTPTEIEIEQRNGLVKEKSERIAFQNKTPLLKKRNNGGKG